MPDSRSVSRTRPTVRLLAVGLALATTLLLGLIVVAHDVLSEFIQHDVRLEAGPEHIDLTIDLTFFEDASEIERRRMDQDGDGRIRRAEVETYVRHLEKQLQKAARLKHGDTPLPLTLLRSPELDLLGDDQVQRSHHRLRLAFFCPTPETLRAGSVLVAELRLFPDWPVVLTVAGSGDHGYQLQAERLTSALQKRLRPDQTRTFRWTVSRVPAMARPGSASASSPDQEIQP